MRMKTKGENKNKYEIVRSISKLKPNQIECFLDHLDDGAIDCICECVYNVINTDLKFSSKKKNKLKAFIKDNCSTARLKQISNKSVPISKRRKALKMEGKGLGLLLSAAIPFLSNLIFGSK